MPAQPTEPVDLAEQIRDLVDVAATYAADGAPQTATDRLLEARALIDSMMPRPTVTPVVPLKTLTETVRNALHRRTPEDIAAVPWVAEAIGQHDDRAGALGELVTMTNEKHRAALVAWIEQTARSSAY
ncbi:hypothetical protein [Streptomyces mutabilis]|uniref:Uncharacterized protein n=1 Tax=Streptomyces mutabilis TaxID=67332 RepID=A0A086MRI4_9ACTN|nr:hypothetical protein [Streptomyces mutabilis]KFG71502.1 hypothetical protein FM21_35200 [Streptomyces mutabilis]